MTRRCGVAALLVAFGAAFWSAPSSAELVLWLKFHYAGIEAFEHGDYAEAETLLRAAVHESHITLPPENPRLALTLDGLGRTLLARGRLDEAERFLLGALEMKKTTIGPKSVEVPKTIANLAGLRYAQGRFDDAERLYRHGLLQLTTNLDQLATARCLNGLARLYHDRGRYIEAETLLLRAKRLNEETDRRTHPNMGATLTNLGILYTALGRYAEAEEMLHEALAVYEKALGPEHPHVATTLRRQGELYRATGRASEAADAETRAHAIRAARTPQSQPTSEQTS